MRHTSMNEALTKACTHRGLLRVRICSRTWKQKTHKISQAVQTPGHDDCPDVLMSMRLSVILMPSSRTRCGPSISPPLPDQLAADLFYDETCLLLFQILIPWSGVACRCSPLRRDTWAGEVSGGSGDPGRVWMWWGEGSGYRLPWEKCVGKR